MTDSTSALVMTVSFAALFSTSLIKFFQNSSALHTHTSIDPLINSTAGLSTLWHQALAPVTMPLFCVSSVGRLLTATGLVNGATDFNPNRIEFPYWSAKNFAQVTDYDCDPYSNTKFGTNLSMGVWWADVWNITNFFSFLLFLGTPLQVRSSDGFSHFAAKQRALMHGV